MALTQPEFYSEGSTPKFNDPPYKIYQKILGAIRDLVLVFDPTASGGTDTPKTLLKTVADSGTPEVLGAAGTTLWTITLFGQKAEGTNNAGKVYVRPPGGAPGVEIAPGDYMTWTAKAGRTLNLADFTIKVDTNNDGVLAAYME